MYKRQATDAAGSGAVGDASAAPANAAVKAGVEAAEGGARNSIPVGMEAIGSGR